VAKCPLFKEECLTGDCSWFNDRSGYCSVRDLGELTEAIKDAKKAGTDQASVLSLLGKT